MKFTMGAMKSGGEKGSKIQFAQIAMKLFKKKAVAVREIAASDLHVVQLHHKSEI